MEKIKSRSIFKHPISLAGPSICCDIRTAVRMCFLRTACCAITHISHCEAGIKPASVQQTTWQIGGHYTSQQRIEDMYLKYLNISGLHKQIYSVTLFVALLFNFTEVTGGMQPASYQAESDLIISSIKAEIWSLKINAIALYCLLCTLFEGAAKSDKEEQSALPPMLWMKCRIFVCMDLVISWGSLCYSTPPLSSPQLQRLKQTLWCLCDNLFAPTGGNTWVNITRRPRGPLSLPL